jgi:DNA repair exonuclease SbcCD ATPase subunit
MSNKDKRESPIVKAVLALDGYLTELERVGGKINSIDMNSDFDGEYVQKLMIRFTECGHGVGTEISNLSRELQEAQSRAESVSQGVRRQAELFNARLNEQNEKLEAFRSLGEKVRDLNTTIGRLRDDREQLVSNIPAFELQLSSLIEEADSLRQSAHASRMRALEKNAESLMQTLQAVRQKLIK